MKITGSQGLAFASMAEGFLVILPIFLILFLIGRIVDVRSTRYVFRTFRYGVYMGSSIILWVLLYSFTEWLTAQIYFGQFLLFLIAAIVIGVGVSSLANFLRRRVLMSKKLKDKEVVNELGAAIGKVSKLDEKRGRILVNTNYGNSITYSVDRITEISDRVVIR